MKREILIAVVLGLIFGGVIVFGFYQSQRRVSSNSSVLPTRPEPSATLSASPTLTRLIINAPFDGQIFNSDIATISGTINPNNYIVILNSVDDVITLSDSMGFFNTELELQPGQNNLIIYAFDESGQIDKKQLSVVFTTEVKNE